MFFLKFAIIAGLISAIIKFAFSFLKRLFNR